MSIFSHPLRNVRRISILFIAVTMLLMSLRIFHASTKSVPQHPLPEEIPASFFGMHIHHMVVPIINKPLVPWPSINVPEWRLWDAKVTWQDLEPAKGDWKFEALDKSVQMAEEHNTGLVMTLWYTPRWASSQPEQPSAYQPGNAAEPKDLGDWQTFVRTVASRYRGRIHVYEIANEPNLKEYWTGTTEQMVELTREAHNIIKGIDSTATIVSPSVTRDFGMKWLADFLNKGGGQYVDVIGYHLYVNPQPPEAMVPLVQKIKQFMAEHGVGNKPLWDTETGWGQPKPFPSEELAAAYVARSYALLWSQGVERFYWYAWDDLGVSVQLTNASYQATLAAQAYDTIQDWLVGARMDYCYQESDQTYACQLNRNGSMEWIVWNPEQTKKYYVAAKWNVKHYVPLLSQERNLDGSVAEIGPVPVLFKN
jgi:hypothetical protein